MTDPLFLSDDLADPLPMVGALLELGGDEGRHAAVVRRIRPGEMIMVGSGRGNGVRGVVVEVRGTGLVVEILSHLATAAEPRCFVAAQALAKGDRSELAVEMMTEMGVSEIVPWQAARSIVRWSGDRGARSLVTTRQLAGRVAQADRALLLHEEAQQSLADVELTAAGTVLIIIGPEGGIAADEFNELTSAGAQPVLISDGVLRTSTAGVVALAALKLRRDSHES
jgi:16S rRNA (uracil1498-N3)-methyltransferase